MFRIVSSKRYVEVEKVIKFGGQFRESMENITIMFVLSYLHPRYKKKFAVIFRSMLLFSMGLICFYGQNNLLSDYCIEATA